MMWRLGKKDDSDVEVVAAYRFGDKKRQQRWYERCRNQFAKGTSRYEGIADWERDELFQNSFILLWEKMEQGQIFIKDGIVMADSRIGIKEIPDLMGYFMRIVKNKYLETLRDGKRIISGPMLEESEEGMDELLWDRDKEIEKDRVVMQALQSLPKSCVEILTMFFYDRLSLKEILRRRPENSSYEGLKTRKAKCMATLKRRAGELYEKMNLRRGF